MNNELIALIGNGPSAANGMKILEQRGEPFLQARMNFFFLENEPRYGTHVDWYFWAVDRKELHDHLRSILRENRYTIGTFMSGAPAEKLNYTNGPVLGDPFFEEENFKQHWQIIAARPALARMMMSRPLPTCGLQALATLAIMGYRRFEMIGMDFYQSSSSRYAYSIPDNLAEKLGAKHTTPGYEAGAHGLKEDLDFFRAILTEFPDLELNYYGECQEVHDIIADVQENRLLWSEAKAEAIESEGVPSAAAAGEAGDIHAQIEALRNELVEAQIEARTARRQLEILRQDTSSRLNKAERQASEAKSAAKAGMGLLNVIANDGMPFSNVVWLVHEMSSMAGVYRPLEAYADYCASETNLRPHIVNLSQLGQPSVRTMAEFVTTKPHVLVVNSIACFHQPGAYAMIDRADKVAIYLHETAWTISRYAEVEPEAYELFKKVVKDATVLCVSPAQADYVQKTFKPRKVELVWNTVNAMLDRQKRKAHAITSGALHRDLKVDHLRIGMIGSFQSRKGTKLFTDVARIFKQAHPQSRFEWVGKRHEGNVEFDWIKFWGPKPPHETQRLLEEFDLVFIPSRDDPQPLVALEAASRGKHMVCFKDIGTAEWLADVPGCAVFSDYTPEAAIEAIMKALSSSIDRKALDEILSERFDVDAFATNLNEAISPLLAEIDNAVDVKDTGKPRRQAFLIGEIETVASTDATVAWDKLALHLNRIQRDNGDVGSYFQLARKLMAHDAGLARKVAFASIARNPAKPSAKRELARFLFECFDDKDLALDLAIAAREQNPTSQAAIELVDRIELAVEGSDHN